MDELREIIGLVSADGNTALLVSIYFIWRLERRVARIEKALEKFLEGGTARGSLA